jgi:hypothetical protein
LKPKPGAFKLWVNYWIQLVQQPRHWKSSPYTAALATTVATRELPPSRADDMAPAMRVVTPLPGVTRLVTWTLLAVIVLTQNNVVQSGVVSAPTRDPVWLEGVGGHGADVILGIQRPHV